MILSIEESILLIDSLIRFYLILLWFYRTWLSLAWLGFEFSKKIEKKMNLNMRGAISFNREYLVDWLFEWTVGVNPVSRRAWINLNNG